MEDSHEGIIDEEIWETVQLEIARRKAYREEHQLKSYIMQSEDNPFTTKVFCGACGSAFGRKNWATSRGKRKVWQCNNRYRIKGVEGCYSSHLDEATLEQIFLKALELLSENIDLLDGKWENILAENRLLDKHYSMALSDLLRQEQMDFNPSDMCRVLDHIRIGLEGEITVRFLEGTEVDL
ncbi:TPA: zinc ribbon domain-containing protein [Streptococcus suis]